MTNRATTVLLAVILTLLVAVGGFVIWQTGEIGSLREELAVVRTQIVTPKVVAPKTAEADGLPDCGTQYDQVATSVQAGFALYAAAGYKNIDVCRDPQTGIKGAIMSRMTLEDVGVGQLVCDGQCDEVVIGYHGHDPDPMVFVTDQQLGTYAEAYNSYCRIDRIELEQLGVGMYVRCGTGEAGGYTTFYVYEPSTDTWTVVRDYSGIKRPDLYARFRDQTSAWDAE